MHEYIDFSQYDAYQKCPNYWYERYINQLRTKPSMYPKDDALTLGSLVHEGLQLFREKGVPEFPDTLVTELNPSVECLGLAKDMVNAYVQAYPKEDWKIEKCEEPIKFGLFKGDEYPPNITHGLAKLDAYFYNEKPAEVNLGFDDKTIILQPGWYVREYKTKAESIDRSLWVAEWNVKMQADFQLLALKALVKEDPKGVLVSVLEKPKKKSPPKRKCKGCGLMVEVGLYFINGDMYQCPMCGSEQKFKPSSNKNKESPELPKVGLFRWFVERSPEDLRQSLKRIEYTAEQMSVMMFWKNINYIYNRTRECVNTIFGKCAYYEAHTNRTPTNVLGDFVKVDALRYVGLDKQNNNDNKI